MSAELATIEPDAFATESEWVTWQFLDHAVKQDQATATCRNELWSVSALGWQSSLSQVASVQPVGHGRDACPGARALAQFRAVDRPGNREPPGRPAPRLFGDGGGRAIDAEPARPDARTTAGRIAADGSGRPRQDARLRRRMEAGHRGHCLARDHTLSRLHAGRVHSTRAQVGLDRGHARRPLVLSRPHLCDDDRGRRPGGAVRASRKSRWRTSAKSRSASAASCSETG